MASIEVKSSPTYVKQSIVFANLVKLYRTLHKCIHFYFIKAWLMFDGAAKIFLDYRS